MGLFSLIGLGLGLIGANKDRKQRQQEVADGKPDAIRRDYEAAGFNPLLGIGGSSGVGYAPTFGSALGNIGAQLANHDLQTQQLSLQKTELEQQNQRLNKLVKQTTLRSNRPSALQASHTVNSVGTSNARRNNTSTPTRLLDGVSRHGGGSGGDLRRPDTEVVNKWLDVWDPEKNRHIRILNPELTESGPAEMATGIVTLETADAVQNPQKKQAVVDFLEPVTPQRVKKKQHTPTFAPSPAAQAEKDRLAKKEWERLQARSRPAQKRINHHPSTAKVFDYGSILRGN